MVALKRKFEEEGDYSGDALDKELEAMKGSEEWGIMDKTERRRYRNMLIARRTRLRFKMEMDELKMKAEELSATRAQLLKQISTPDVSPLSVSDLAQNHFDPPKIVDEIMKRICGSDKVQETAFCVMSSVSPKCPIVYATDAYLRLSGYSFTELIGKPGLFLCGDADVSRTEEMLRTGQDFQATVASYRKNGEAFRNVMHFSNLCDQKGRSFLVIAKCEEEFASRGLVRPVCVPDFLRPASVKVSNDSWQLPVKVMDSEDYHTPTHIESTFSPPKTMPAQVGLDVDPVLTSFREINQIMDMLPHCGSVDDVDVLNCPSFEFMGQARVF